MKLLLYATRLRGYNKLFTYSCVQRQFIMTVSLPLLAKKKSSSLHDGEWIMKTYFVLDLFQRLQFVHKIFFFNR